MPSPRNVENNWKPCDAGEINHWLQSKKHGDQQQLARRNLLKALGLTSLVVGVGGVSYFVRGTNGPILPVNDISCPMCIQNLRKYHDNELARQVRAEVALHLKKCKTCDRIYRSHYQKIG